MTTPRIFMPKTHQGRVIIERVTGEDQKSYSIEMSPAEAVKASYVVGLALSMIELENIPDHIKNTPFVVRFFPHKVFALERTDAAGSLPFRVAEGDELILTIRMAVDMALNEQTLGRAVRATGIPSSILASEEPL